MERYHQGLLLCWLCFFHSLTKTLPQACISANAKESHSGVSRPTIKKYAEDQYNLDMNATALSLLRRALAKGEEDGTFVFPKGPSGKVKLAPKNKPLKEVRKLHA